MDHPYSPWLCQACGRTFRTPRTISFNVGKNPDHYIFAEDIPRLERIVSQGIYRPNPGVALRSRSHHGIRNDVGWVLVVAAFAGAVGAGMFFGVFDSEPQEPDPQGVTLALVSTPIPIAPPVPTPTLVPTPTPIPPAHLRHHDEKLYMLELINQARAGAGAPPVVLGDNHAAQLHAESGLANCFGSHWGIDGVSPNPPKDVLGDSP